jgi:hypothetical protein
MPGVWWNHRRPQGTLSRPGPGPRGDRRPEASPSPSGLALVPPCCRGVRPRPPRPARGLVGLVAHPCCCRNLGRPLRSRDRSQRTVRAVTPHLNQITARLDRLSSLLEPDLGRLVHLLDERLPQPSSPPAAAAPPAALPTSWWRRWRRPTSTPTLTTPAPTDSTGNPALVAGAIVAVSVLTSPTATDAAPVLPATGGSFGGAGASGSTSTSTSSDSGSSDSGSSSSDSGGADGD